MSVQRSEADAKIYKLFWGEHRPSVAFRLRGAELFLPIKRREAGVARGVQGGDDAPAMSHSQPLLQP